MGKRGEGRRALGASFMAGGLGCLIGTFTLAAAIPAARPLIYLMGSPELFVVMLWGLSIVAVLAGPRPVKSLIAAAFGLLLATAGQQAQSGTMRLVIALPLLVFLYTLIEGEEKWHTALLATACTCAIVWGLFEYMLETRWPPGILFG